MAYTMVLNTKKLNFAPDESIGGLYGSAVQPSPVVLETGASYVFMWDGVKYTVNASNTEWGELVGVAVGNQKFVGGTDTGEPFIVAYIPSANTLMCVTDSTDATHTVMFMVEDDTPTFAVEATTISNIANAIRGKTGETTPMQVTDMAALIGGLTVSSGTSIKIVSGQIPGGTCVPGESCVVTHNLGIRPDLIMLFIGATSDIDAVLFSYGFSSDLITATGYKGYKGLSALVGTTSDYHYVWNAGGTIDQAKGDCIQSANATTFTAFTDTFKAAQTATYRYVVIGGLV